MNDQSEPFTPPFVDAALLHDPDPLITYRSGLVSYQESLSGGVFVGRSWNGSGYTNPRVERLDPTRHPTPQAFWVEIESQLLCSHWEWAGWQKQQDEKGLHVVVELSHRVRPVGLRVHTLLDGTPLITRYLEITNLAEHPVAISQASPWSGLLQQVSHRLDETDSPYDLGYFTSTHAFTEGRFEWRTLLYAAGHHFTGRYRSNSFRPPFFILRNGRTGEHWIGSLAWSGGYICEFDLSDGGQPGVAQLFFRAGPDAPGPLRVLDPDETVTTPEMHLGLVLGDLDETVQALHDHLRQTVFYPPPPGRAGLVETGIGPEERVCPETLAVAPDIAAAIGAEVLYLDAGWSTRVPPPQPQPWTDLWLTIGDWRPHPDIFPEGLDPLRERLHSQGLLFGLWTVIERFGYQSKMAQEHPTWLAEGYDGEKWVGGAGGTGRTGSVIDLAIPEAAQWVEDEMARIIAEYRLDFFRLDSEAYFLMAAGQTRRNGFIENSYWRHYDALYDILGRLRRRFPDVIFESCAGGGGRADIGLTRYFNHTWISDCQTAPRSFAVLNGMTLALPPERVDRLGGMPIATQRAGELDFQTRLLLFAHPTYGWLALQDTEPNPVLLVRIKRALDLYKQFVRPFHPTSRLYHHTPILQGLDPHGWGVLELASRERDRAIVGLFRLSDPAEPEYWLRLRGINIGRRYRVTFDNTGEQTVLDGYALVKTGLPFRLEAPLTSELLLIEAIS